ncbi:MAG: trypsin-like peptidase domain-containing protein [Planctomycetota bacterium]|nr:trypsin-like peptidase domain-containing protein [Planctomycetota bacterium]
MFRKNAVAWFAVGLSATSLVYNASPRRSVPAVAPMASEEVKTAKALSKAFNNVADYVHESVVQITAEGKRPQRSAGNNNRRGPNPNVPNPGGPGGQQMTPEQFEELFKRFFPEGASPFRFEREQLSPTPSSGTGSGFVFDTKGHIVTNNHVVEGAETIKVSFHDGEEFIAKLVGRDPQSDIAVLKVEKSDCRPLELGDSVGLKVGELVMAVGSPFGLDSSFTVGVVSATHRNDLGIVGQRGYEDFIQTDAAINPGNSGGPLVDMNGHVVGVNSAIVSGSRGNDGVGFAIPIDMASKLAEKIIARGKVERAMMGINLGPLSPSLARQFGLDPKTPGAMVQDVVPGSPAANAGLKSGDIITRFDNKSVDSWLALRNRVSVSDIGKPYELTFMRDGRESVAKVVLGAAEKIDPLRSEPEAGKPVEAKPEPASATSFEQFGLSLQPITPELADKFGYGKESRGLLVAAVKEGSPAEAIGLQEGFLISKVVKNRNPVVITSVKEFQELSEKSDELAIYVQSPRGPGGRFMTLAKQK